MALRPREPPASSPSTREADHKVGGKTTERVGDPQGRERQNVFQHGWSRVPRGTPRGQASVTAPETPYVKPLPTGSRAKRARCASYGSGTRDLPTAA